jgi:4,4'-diaponeurosporenoate glycosyltransferase
LYLSLTILCLGLLFGILLFFKRPILTDEGDFQVSNKLSVIIPARNEEFNLPHILEDLKNQNKPVYEIICVNDASDDNTAEVALSNGVTLINVTDKPNGWVGKSWACQTGANQAKGDTFLFLDADVRLGPDAVDKLEKAAVKHNCVISVQPYHKTVKFYEQLSFYFNLILIAANGVGFPLSKKNIGLFGPVILIGRDKYKAIDGHSSAQNSIVDDLSLGEKLIAKGIKFKLFIGGEDLSFRMYSGGFRQLIQGWTKNFATGASKTSYPLMLMIVLWISSCISAIIYLLGLLTDYSTQRLMFSILVYVFVAAELLSASHHIGNFKKWLIILFPIQLIFFLSVFLSSVFKKVFRIKVKWKGRKIELER